MTAELLPSSQDENYAYCDMRLKAGDHAAWLAALFAPAAKRPYLHALGAFAVDLAEVRGKVREPLAGELRLQWWTDAIEGEARGDVRGHPVASALIDTIRATHLSRAALTDLVEARREDLYDDPIASLDNYAKRADRIDGALIGLKAQVLLGRRDPVVETAARHAGRVLAVADTLRALTDAALPLHMTVPLDLLRAERIGAAELLVRRTSPAILAALAALRRFALDNIAALQALRGSLDPGAAPALLTANVATRMLQATQRRSYDPFGTQIELSPWRRQWILWRAAGKNGVL